MAEKYSKEKFWKLYDTLPQELKDALFAEETGDDIEEACRRNGLEEKMEDIVDYVGRVLIGVLPPADFKGALEKDLGIDPEKAKKIDQEIFRTIFYPVKAALEQISKADTIRPEVAVGEMSSPEGQKEEAPSSKRDDSYREPVE